MFKKFPRIRWITFLITLVSPQIAFSFYLLIYNLSLYKFLNNLPRNSLESNLAVIIIFFIFPFSFYCFTTLIYSKKVITDKKNAEFDSCIFSLLWIVELILLGIIFLFLLDGVFAEYINNEAEVTFIIRFTRRLSVDCRRLVMVLGYAKWLSLPKIY